MHESEFSIFEELPDWLNWQIAVTTFEIRRLGPTGSPVRGIIERPDFFLPGPSSSERQMMSSSEEYRRFFWADFGLGLGLGLALPLPRAPGTDF